MADLKLSALRQVIFGVEESYDVKIHCEKAEEKGSKYCSPSIIFFPSSFCVVFCHNGLRNTVFLFHRLIRVSVNDYRNNLLEHDLNALIHSTTSGIDG